MKNADGVSVRIPEENTPLGKPRLRRQNNIKMKLREVGWVVMNWINVAANMDCWRACVSAVISIRVTKTVEDIYSSSGTTSFSSRTLLRRVLYTPQAFMKADVRRLFEDEGEEPTESVPVSNPGGWWFTGYLDSPVS